MTDVALAPAILNYITNSIYPESDTLAASKPTADDLSQLLQELRKVQGNVREEIQNLSRATGPSVDQWIAQAKQLEKDIQKSRETARQIVSEAENAKQSHKTQSQDAGAKVRFLEDEVEFNDRLVGTLEHVQHANSLLSQVQDAIVAGQVSKAAQKLDDAQASVEALRNMEGSRTYSLLKGKVEKLLQDLKEAITRALNALLVVDRAEHTLTIHQHLSEGKIGASPIDHDLAATLDAASQIGALGEFLKGFTNEVRRTLVFHRLNATRDGKVAHITEHGNTLTCNTITNDTSYPSLFGDIVRIIKFLTSHLPSAFAQSISHIMMPSLITRLKEEWLEPVIPLAVSELHDFLEILTLIRKFADEVESCGWSGTDVLVEWTDSAPSLWITKRREALLGDARNLVFTGLREKHTVERVETQMVGQDDEAEDGGDAWDTAWDENEDTSPSHNNQTKNPAPSADDDDDASAWDVEDTEGGTEGKDGNDDDDAWGWTGDDGQEASSSQQPSSTAQPASNFQLTHKTPAPPKPAEKELTLRETYTVTGIPQALLKLIQQIISDAQTLAGPTFTNTPVAPVANALYLLPTLALAIYRATASTAYSRLDTGNILLYNDSSHLADELRAWQESQPAMARLRLDNDVSALGKFAKRAYSAEMEAQRTILRDLLDGAQGFSNCSEQPFKSECESAIDETVNRLRDVNKFWTNILPSSALLQSIGSLLATVLTKILTDVMDLPDISAADSTQLKLLCDRASTAKTLFVQKNPDGTEADMTFIYCPIWLKFQYLAEILESSLADIKWLWSDGELRLEFAPEEVVGLIEALFADSGLRRQAIADVRRSVRG